MHMYWLILGFLAALPLAAQQSPPVPVDPAPGSRSATADPAAAVRAALDALDASLVDVPAGRFRMGDLRNTGRDEERPVHEVRLRAFRMMRHEVTFAQYDAFARATNRPLPDDRGFGRQARPVINVNTDDADAFAGWASRQTGRRLRLPSEAEWEYAARAGTETEYFWGNVFDARRANNDKRSTVPVAQYPANAWGLHDMSGNVWEWTGDCWNGSFKGAPVDGSAWRAGNCHARVARGGGWIFAPEKLRSAYRFKKVASKRYDSIGFRLVEELP